MPLVTTKLTFSAKISSRSLPQTKQNYLSTVLKSIYLECLLIRQKSGDERRERFIGWKLYRAIVSAIGCTWLHEPYIGTSRWA
jgi:hypothetical protein